jgi:uncharacterized protein (TIGR02466 family)
MKLAILTRQLFPTPVASVDTPDAAARNDELRAIILERRRSRPTIQASNDGGWHSDRDLMAWGGARAAEVLTMARAIANHLTRDRAGREVQPDWIVSAWANVNGRGAANICHYHPGSFWSGTYYVDDGGINADPSLGGDFEMLDPRGSAPAMAAPMLAYAGEGGLGAGATEWIRPRPGLLVLFPSWVHHQVRAYRGNRERISIAFNLRVHPGD